MFKSQTKQLFTCNIRCTSNNINFFFFFFFIKKKYQFFLLKIISHFHSNVRLYLLIFSLINFNTFQKLYFFLFYIFINLYKNGYIWKSKNKIYKLGFSRDDRGSSFRFLFGFVRSFSFHQIKSKYNLSNGNYFSFITRFTLFIFIISNVTINLIIFFIFIIVILSDEIYLCYGSRIG